MFDLRKIFAVPKDFLKSKNYCTSKLKFGSGNCVRPCKIILAIILWNSDIHASVNWCDKHHRDIGYIWHPNKSLAVAKVFFLKKNKETNNQGQVRKKSYQSVLPQKSIKFSSNEDKWRNNKLGQKIVILNLI